jgi:hypothetical protein
MSSEQLAMSNESKKDLIELRILGAIRKLLTGRVNELLHDFEFDIPIIEFGNFGCGYGMVPMIALSLCECSEKERTLRLDAYTVTISFSLPETFESEVQCYAYCGAVCRAIKESPTLGGVVDRVTITGEKYTPPKKPGCGDGWGVAITLKVTIENER